MPDTRNPHVEQAVRDSFAMQQFMATIGARLTVVAAGEIEIRVPFRPDLTQQHGFLHAGVVASALDSACGYAGGRVVRAGRTITVCQAEASMLSHGTETLTATMLATIMTLRDRPNVVG